MRELKFRVWSESDQEYRTDCKLRYLFTSPTGLPSTVYSDEGDEFNIEQYTGLKDKNGKEIYEGDIVKLYIKNKLYGVFVVVYDELNAVYELCKNGDIDTAKYIMGGYHFKYIVIGNIHENPELLEEADEP